MQCVVIHSWENGIIRQLDAFDTGMETADDTAYGGMVGALIGIIGGPLGMLLGGSMGALMGSMVDMDDSLSNESLIEKVMDVFSEGEVALIALVQELKEGALDKAIDRSGADILKLDAAEVAEEIRQAQEIQKQMAKEAKKQLRDEKKAEHKENVAARREKMKDHFDNDQQPPYQARA